jgi:sirohydrochlorin cobaltochelatase
MTSSLILFAHGARDPRWAAPFEAVAERIRVARPHLEVRLAFLEFMSPDLAAAGAELARAGCTRVVVVPMFLGAGGHVRKDLPVRLDQLRAAWPAVEFVLQPAIGELPEVIDAMALAAGTAADIGSGS